LPKSTRANFISASPFKSLIAVAYVRFLYKFLYQDALRISSRTQLWLKKLLLWHNQDMSKQDKLLLEILTGESVNNIPFDGLRNFLLQLGFTERIRGSHHVFRKEGVEDKINLQKDGSKAKPYQVRQVRSIMAKYGLGGKR